LLQSSGRTSGRTTPVMSKMDTVPTETVIDKVIALYPYTAQNADELSFEKDDIIAVTDRSQDPAWWQGTMGGLIAKKRSLPGKPIKERKKNKKTQT
ncbi:jg22549, partial [Pararge aegeria aegeria]